ncbi:MAG: xanthine dehydrogenase family protein molybdopterin-binding subunit [Dehalococcoidia bacterium]|nr:xanthine dehydrogenase family protein molybdopterin-binding subunit [Dehalococcoidia bacterium]
MRYAGKPIKRFEDARLITGNGVYIDDVRIPDMLYAVVVRSDHAHALIRSISTNHARESQGVVDVITGVDLVGVLPNIPIRAMGDRSVDEFNPPEHPVLAQDKVCYVGQPVAVVVAENPYLARDGAELVEVDYQPLAPVIDPELAVDPDTSIIHQNLGTNMAIRSVQQGGDIDQAFTQAHHIVRQRYQIPRLAPSPLEPRGVVADYDPLTDLMTVWDSTQAPHQVQRYLAQSLNRSVETIRVVAPDVGGSFGIKDCLFSEDILMPFLSLRLQRPVKWIEGRQDNLLTYHGRGMRLDVEAAVKSDGRLLGIRANILADMGAYFYFTAPFPLFNAARRITGPYDIPAVRADILGVITNKTPVAAYRGTGSPEAAFSIERTMDLIAQDLNLDPVAVRRINYIPKTSFPYRSCTGNVYDSGDYDQVLDRALELSEYYDMQERKRHRKPHEPLLGIGLATFIKSSGAGGEHRTENAEVKIDESGRVDVYTGVSPHGQGTETTFAQITADMLGVEPQDVRVLHSDSSIFPHGIGTSASRGVIIGGSAVQQALQAARDKLSLLACHKLACSTQDLAFQGGKVFDRHHPDRAIGLVQLATIAHDLDSLPSGMEPGLDFLTEYTLPQTPVSFGAHVVVVEVHPETFAIKILRYVGVHDCGQIVNPMIVEGQIHGGIAQGIGQALIEQIIYNEDGQSLTASFLDYAIPRAIHIPDLILDTVDTISPTNPLGAKGIGSVSTVPSPPAIANAVMNAISSTGIRHIDAPYTQETLWRSVTKAITPDCS